MTLKRDGVTWGKSHFTAEIDDQMKIEADSSTKQPSDNNEEAIDEGLVFLGIV